MTRYIGKITEAHRDDKIKWLVITPHVHLNAVVGYYMLFHEDLNQSSIWDTWYQTLEQALDHGEDYGINKEDWQVENSN
jgi:hypothetical protein